MRTVLVLAAVAGVVLASSGAVLAASASFATESHDCALYGFFQPVFACSVAQEGAVRAEAADCVPGGCVVRVVADVRGEVQVPGLLGITGEVLHGDARDAVCHAVTSQPAQRLACSGDAVLFVPVAPGACEDFLVASRIVEVLLSIVVSANPQFRADAEHVVHLCRDAAGAPSLG